MLAEITKLDPPLRCKPAWGGTHASFVKWISFWWTYDLLKIGKKRELVEDDIDEIDERDSCKYLVERFFEGWNRQLERNPKNPNLYWTILYMLGFKRFIFTSASVSLYFFFNFINVILLQLILEYIEDDGKGNVSFSQACWYCLGMFISVVLFNAHQHWMFYTITKMGINARQAMSCVILHKSLEISPNTLASAQVINLMSSDSQRFERTIRRSILIWMVPLLIPGIIYLCYSVGSAYPMLGLVLYLLLYVIS